MAFALPAYNRPKRFLLVNGEVQNGKVVGVIPRWSAATSTNLSVTMEKLIITLRNASNATVTVYMKIDAKDGHRCNSACERDGSHFLQHLLLTRLEGQAGETITPLNRDSSLPSVIVGKCDGRQNHMEEKLHFSLKFMYTNENEARNFDYLYQGSPLDGAKVSALLSYSYDQ
jgi:hypothetical protein